MNSHESAPMALFELGADIREDTEYDANCIDYMQRAFMDKPAGIIRHVFRQRLGVHPPMSDQWFTTLTR